MHSGVIQNIIRAQANSILNSERTTIRKPAKSYEYNTNLERGHDRFGLCRIQLQDPIENGNLLVSEWFIASSMELQERFEFCFLVGVLFFRSQYPIQELSNRPRDRSFETLVQSKKGSV